MVLLVWSGCVSATPEPTATPSDVSDTAADPDIDTSVAIDDAADAFVDIDEALPDITPDVPTTDILDVSEDVPPDVPETVEPECAPDTYCKDGVAGSCTSAGLWLPSQDCGAEGLLCVGGSCREPCEVEVDEEGISGCDHWAVALAHGQNQPFAIATLNVTNVTATVAVWGRNDAQSAPEVVASATVGPGHLHAFPLPPSTTAEPGRHWTGWRVQSTAPVIAYQHSPLAGMSATSGDGALLLPAQGMGTEFIAAGRPEGRSAEGTRTRGTLTVVAAEPGTQLTIIPSVAMQSGDAAGLMPAGEQFLVPLQPHEVLHLTTDVEGGDLSGSLLFSSKPVAVFAGHEADRGAAETPASAEGDHLEDALRPVSRWGRTHVIAKTIGMSNMVDGVLILAAENDTLVQFDPPIHQDLLLARGEQVLRTVSDHVMITAGRPIQVMQLTAGADALTTPPNGTTCVIDAQCAPGYSCENFACTFPQCEGAMDPNCPPGHQCRCEKTECRCDPTGDAAWWVVPPVEQFETTTWFVAPPTYPDHQAAFLVSSEVETLLLDGFAIDPPMTPVGDAGWRVATVTVQSGSHVVSGEGPIGVVMYGYGRDTGYGHAGAQALRDLRGPLCDSNSDCPATTPPCFGFPECDTTQTPARCSLIPDSAVTCTVPDNPCVFMNCEDFDGVGCAETMAPDGTPCTSVDTACAVGSCQFGVCVNAGVPCDDGVFCNGVETCDESTNNCVAGVAPELDDGIGCTLDVCNDDLGIVMHTPQPELCDDGFVCNGYEVCDLFEGCVHQALSICDDGVFCNGVETCDDEDCFPGTPPTVDDEIDCTLDACNEALGIVAHVQDHAVCDDGDACTVDTCDLILGCVHAPEPCSTEDACTLSSCDSATGCAYQALDCDDNDACTTDICDGESGCQHTDLVCDDDDICTPDFCIPSTGCVFGDTCNDNDACTVDGCVTVGDCTNEDLDCDDDDPCTTDLCDQTSGCFHLNLCDDGNACTVDICDASSCTYETLVCDDDDLCTNDSCDPLTGCENVAKDCDDNDLCTGDSCDDNGLCVNQAVDCDDDNACTNDVCDTTGSCTHTAIDCSDGVDCTVDTCHSELGCENQSPCDDGLLCTVDTCLTGGGCEWPTMDCDDANPCTEDSCDNVSGCIYVDICGEDP